ncbi:hypothetical protein LUD75_17425 [Epilithonimonas sp. JDS]|uniref:hypothetical protein n=1 Tax=Epilithonimonas sp. JDS TaxID=2902797 RepID=UPI001E2BE9C2|nr:hypothetical protein [Epilithonimonas sp. JDS]MCD9856506.1 hypothetical protein [Epilithonimonas sp. JDS]
MFKNLNNTNRHNFFLFVFFLGTFCFSQVKTDNSSDVKNFVNKAYFYNIVADSIISKDKILMLKYYDFESFNPGQSTIAYDYCTSVEKCEEIIRKNKSASNFTHYEMTGVIIKNDKFWMHPPRSNNFRILEMNAFPYIEFTKNTWYYELDFGNQWGDKKWIEWEGRRTSKSNYKVIDSKKVFKLGNDDIECIEIQTNTVIPNLGNTKSVFYYNSDYGFVRMLFTTIDGRKIEFNLTKVGFDSDL